MSRFPRCIRAFPTFHSGSNMQDACVEIFHLAKSALVCCQAAALGGRELAKKKTPKSNQKVEKRAGFAVGSRFPPEMSVFPASASPWGVGVEGAPPGCVWRRSRGVELRSGGAGSAAGTPAGTPPCPPQPCWGAELPCWTLRPLERLRMFPAPPGRDEAPRTTHG